MRFQYGVGSHPAGGYCTPPLTWNTADTTPLDEIAQRAGIAVAEGSVTAYCRSRERPWRVHLPARNRWYSTEFRASTLAHECIHALGDWDDYLFSLGDKTARNEEEVIAEMGAILVFEALDWVYPDHNFTYLASVGGWRHDLEEKALQRVDALLHPTHATRDTGAGGSTLLDPDEA